MEHLILDLLFPRRCPLCGKISNGICADCAKKIRYVRQPFCYRCGRPLAGDEDEFCPACSTRPFAFTQGRALYVYADPVREAMHAVKYKNKREYLEYFADDLARRLGGVIRGWDPQALIPVPMYPQARRRRGYNQAELLAGRLGARLGLPVCGALQKIRKTADQKELDDRARRTNLRGAFAVRKKFCVDGRLPWERVVLVDDIYTTGSTVHEAAKTLRSAGVRQVYFVTLCIVSATAGTGPVRPPAGIAQAHSGSQ